VRPVWSDRRAIPITAFEMVASEPGRYASPAQVDWGGALAAQVPATVAGVLAAHGQLDLSAPPDLDGRDFWFRARVPQAQGAERLVCEGLATLCDVWLAGEHLLRAENMFRRYELALAAPPVPGAELVLRCGALGPELARRRPRPRFRTHLVDAQQLRWVRTSLLGRTPGFAPRLPAVGPYRPISLELGPALSLRDQSLRLSVERIERGEVGVELSFTLVGVPAAGRPRATLVLAGEALHARAELGVERCADGLRCAGRFSFEGAALWWPHTHGPQPRSRLSVELELAGELPRILDFGQVGFRSLDVERGADGAGFALAVNGQRVFCRGACWTTSDLVGLGGRGLHDALRLARAAGMNMLRVPGTMLYESDAFYEACDQLGVLVFQDFMFANMDYPAGDPAFAAEVHAEAQDFLARTSGRPCLALLCGGSEIEQQAAMLGLPAELGRSPLFYELLPELARRARPDVPYVPNSPCGGALPFQVDAGIAHYYGVGAYLRPLHDARLSGVRFAAECLAFANVPNSRALDALLGDLEAPFHHPRWKERVPRDRGAGWDFEDVRDHYLESLYQLEPRRLRREDPERYLELSRSVVVDVMEATLAELRRAGSSCGGALIWWLKDLWLGAGWGVLDARGAPKSAYYALRRSFAALALLVTDEGMNGPELHVAHDGTVPLEARLAVTLYRAGRTPIAHAQTELALAARSVHRVRVDALFPRFVDAGYVYRFGPPNHDLLVAELQHADAAVARAFVCPLRADVTHDNLGLSATCEARAGHAGVLLRTQAFARRVALELETGEPADNYFHLEPGGERWIEVRTVDGAALDVATLRGRVKALNASSWVQLAGAAAAMPTPEGSS
jgi:beta-mannosidase